jgi:hypothetical protein
MLETVEDDGGFAVSATEFDADAPAGAGSGQLENAPAPADARRGPFDLSFFSVNRSGGCRCYGRTAMRLL